MDQRISEVFWVAFSGELIYVSVGREETRDELEDEMWEEVCWKCTILLEYEV